MAVCLPSPVAESPLPNLDNAPKLANGPILAKVAISQCGY